MEYDIVFIKCPDLIHGGFGIEFLSEKSEKVSEFHLKILKFFSSDKKNFPFVFRQGSDRVWSYYEFWSVLDHDLFLERVFELAESLGVEVDFSDKIYYEFNSK